MISKTIFTTQLILTISAASALAQNTKIDPAVSIEMDINGSADVLVLMEQPSAGASNIAEVAFERPGTFFASSLADAQLSRVRTLSTGSAGAILDAEALQAVANIPQVARIVPNRADRPALFETVEITGASVAWVTDIGTGANNLGEGFSIAILDSGIDLSHPFFEGKEVVQACFSRHLPTQGIESLCPGGELLDTGDVVDLGPNSASGCPTDLAGCEHGTHVTGIAAGKRVLHDGRELSGIAPNASIVAVQVFSKFTRATDCFPEPAPCILSFRSSQIRALDFVQSLAQQRQSDASADRIAAVNMSLGGDEHFSHCDDESGLTRGIDELRAAGIATFIASGNEHFRQAVSHPACVSSAIAVGATDKSGALSSFTNRADGSLVDLVTVGAGVLSSIPGGTFEPFDGTSMATPVAAGSWILMQSIVPDTTVTQLEAHLERTAQPTLDPVRGTETQRGLDLQAAIDQIGLIDLTPVASASSAVAEENPWSLPEFALNGDAMANTFILRLPVTSDDQLSSAIAGARDTLQSELGSGDLQVTVLPNNQLQITTDEPISAMQLENSIRGLDAGAIERLLIDEGRDRAFK